MLVNFRNQSEIMVILHKPQFLSVLSHDFLYYHMNGQMNKSSNELKFTWASKKFVDT